MNAVSPKVVSIHTVDASTVHTVVDSIIAPGMSLEEKALAIWRFCWEHTYHWPAPREWPAESHELDVVYDAVKLLNVYGYTYCFAIRALAEALYEAAGLEARSAGVSGHVVPEVYYEGRYHYLDNDQRGFARLSDGRIAALEDYRTSGRQLLSNPDQQSRPFFPSSKRPLVPYEQALVGGGYLCNRSVHYYQHDKYRTVHSMNLALRPGERFVRNWSHTGRWLWSMPVTNEFKANGYADPREGPQDPYTRLYEESSTDEYGKPMSFANGLLIYRPDLRTGADDYKDGVDRDSNMDASGPGFHPREARRVATADFRVRLPYVIVGWPGDVEKPGVQGAAVLSGQCRREKVGDRVELLVSVDGGESWTSVWKSSLLRETEKFAVDLSEQVAGRYEYRVRFKLRAASRPEDVCIKGFGLDTACQMNAKTLPAVRNGKNRMTVNLESGPEVFEADIQYGNSLRAVHKRLLRKLHGLVIENKSHATLGPAKAGGTGSVVYEVPVEPGKKIAWLKINAAFRSHFKPTPSEQYRIYYAVGRASGWKLLHDADPAPYLGHWCFEVNEEVPLPCAAEKVFVKIVLKRSPVTACEGGKLVGVRFVWGSPAGGAHLPRGGIRIVHHWKQGSSSHRKEKVVTRDPQTYTFNVSGKRVKNTALSLEWAERPPVDSAPHALMRKPPCPTRRALSNMRKAHAARKAVEVFDVTPTVKTVGLILQRKNLDWLQGSLPPALVRLGGKRARQLLQGLVGRIDRAEGCLMELLCDEGPTEALAEFLQDSRLDIRIRAARLLAERGDGEARSFLLSAIARESSEIALGSEVAAFLRLDGKLDGIDVRTLLQACEPRAQIEVAAALARKGHRLGMQTLTKWSGNRDRYVRYEAAKGLIGSQTEGSDGIFLKLLEDSSCWVRQVAIAGLAQQGKRSALIPLRDIQKRDSRHFLRQEAEWAIREIRSRLS